jgi:hypothetical protein
MTPRVSNVADSNVTVAEKEAGPGLKTQLLRECASAATNQTEKDGVQPARPDVTEDSSRVSPSQARVTAPTMLDGLAELAQRTSKFTAAPTGSRIQGALDWILFVAFLLPGFFSIFILKRYGIDPTIVAGIAAGFMVTYGVLAYSLPRVRVRPDRLGDNIYYMGFVFTLASMSAAILDLQGGADISTLIGSFGIALFSTIVGIAGRVVLLQMRTEVEDIEELVQRDLLNQASKLRGQLTAAVNDLEVFRLGVRHSLEQRLTEAFAAHEAALEQQLKKLEALTTEVTESIRASFTANESTAVDLRQAATESADALRAITKRFGKISPPSDILDKKLAGTMTRVEQVIAQFEKTAMAESERHQALKNAALGLDTIVGALQRDIARFADAASALGRAGTPVEQLGKAFEAFASQVEAARGVLATQQETAANSHAQQERVVSALGKSQAALTELNNTLVRAVDTADGTGAALGASIRGVMEALDANHAKLAEHASQSGPLREQIKAGVDASLAARTSVPTAVAAAASVPTPIPSAGA